MSQPLLLLLALTPFVMVFLVIVLVRIDEKDRLERSQRVMGHILTKTWGRSRSGVVAVDIVVLLQLS